MLASPYRWLGRMTAIVSVALYSSVVTAGEEKPVQSCEANPTTCTKTENPSAPGSGRSTERLVCIKCPKPQYPRSVLRQGTEGSVMVVFNLNSNGRPVSLRIWKSSGNPELDLAALEVVQQWQFEPPAQEGQRVKLRVNFEIEGSSQQRQRQQGQPQELREEP